MRTLVSSLCVLCITATVMADTVVLNDGRKIVGRIASEEDRLVMIDTMVGNVWTRLKLSRDTITSIEKGDVPDDFFAVKPTTRPNMPPPPPVDQPTEASRLAQWRQRLTAIDTATLEGCRANLKQVQKDLAGLRSQKTVTSWETKPLEEKSRDLQKRIAELTKTIAATKTASWDDLLLRIRAVEDDDARKAAAAKELERKLAILKTRYNTPEKAADFCVNDLLAKGVVRAAERVGITQQGEMPKCWLYGMLYNGRDANMMVPFSRVAYKFTFITKAGLLREHVGEINVGQMDGIWEPCLFDVDGVPGNGQVYPFARKLYLLTLEEEELKAKRGR